MFLVLFVRPGLAANRTGPFRFRASVLPLNMAPYPGCLYTLMVNFKNKYAMMIYTIPEKRTTR
jgi:hypothetical protein